MLPSVRIGTSKLVDRDALLTFLAQIRDAEDGTGLLGRVRKQKPKTVERPLRSLVRRDLDPVDLASLPDSIELSRGRLVVSFHSTEQLAESMLMLARILENDGDAFAKAFEPEPPPQDTLDREEMREIAALLDGSSWRV